MPKGQVPIPPEAPYDTRLWTVRAYILAYLPNLIMTRDEQGERSLIGGEVPVSCYFEGYPLANGELVARLARYTYTQTGLHLLRVFPAVNVDFFTRGERFEVSMTFLALAHGRPDRGIRVTAETLPELHYACGRAAELLTRHQTLFSAETVARLLTPCEQLEGVFKTERAIGKGPDGTPLHELLRFYPDGLVLQGAVAARARTGWAEWGAWFHRDRRDGRIGRGHYQLDRGVLAFSTVAASVEGRTLVTDHEGTRWGERLWITESIRGLTRAAEQVFSRLPTTPPERRGPRLRWPWQKRDAQSD